MMSDHLSRHPIVEYTSNRIAEDFVIFVVQHILPKSLRLFDVAAAIKDVCILKYVINAVETNMEKSKNTVKLGNLNVMNSYPMSWQ